MSWKKKSCGARKKENTMVVLNSPCGFTRPNYTRVIAGTPRVSPHSCCTFRGNQSCKSYLIHISLELDNRKINKQVYIHEIYTHSAPRSHHW